LRSWAELLRAEFCSAALFAGCGQRPEYGQWLDELEDRRWRNARGIARQVHRAGLNKGDAGPIRITAADPLNGGSRGHNREFLKLLKVVGIEGVNSLNAICQHGRDDLQVEYVATGDGVTTEQV
jgi:hypothetical protein